MKEMGKRIRDKREECKLTQEELAEIIGITRKSIVSNMKKLQENGLIKRIGADKNGHWEVIAK